MSERDCNSHSLPSAERARGVTTEQLSSCSVGGQSAFPATLQLGQKHVRADRMALSCRCDWTILDSGEINFSFFDNDPLEPACQTPRGPGWKRTSNRGRLKTTCFGSPGGTT